MFARAENVQKDEFFEPPSPLAGEVFRVSEVTAGYVYELPAAKHLGLGFGIQGSVNFVPSRIRFAYGDDPTGVMPFIRLAIRQRPARQTQARDCRAFNSLTRSATRTASAALAAG